MRRLALALLFVPSVALADDTPAPVSPWVVTGAESGTVKITAQGETSLGTVAGWKCKAVLSTEGSAGQRVDSLVVSCAKGDLRARAQARHKEGTPVGEAIALQVTSADESKVYRTLMFGPV